MVEKGLASGGQFDAVHAAAHQLDANLSFEIADLAAEGRLRRVQPFLSRERQAALLGDRRRNSEGAVAPWCLPYLQGMVPSLQSLFHCRYSDLHPPSTVAIWNV